MFKFNASFTRLVKMTTALLLVITLTFPFFNPFNVLLAAQEIYVNEPSIQDDDTKLMEDTYNPDVEDSCVYDYIADEADNNLYDNCDDYIESYDYTVECADYECDGFIYDEKPPYIGGFYFESIESVFIIGSGNEQDAVLAIIKSRLKNC